MAKSVRRAEYYYALFEDKSGVGHGLLQYFEQKGVKLFAFTAFPVGRSRSQIDFFPESPKALRAAMAELGVELIGPRHAFIVQGAGSLNEIVDHHEILADAGINVIASNGVTDAGGHFGYVMWVERQDYEKAAELLEV